MSGVSGGFAGWGGCSWYVTPSTEGSGESLCTPVRGLQPFSTNLDLSSGVVCRGSEIDGSACPAWENWAV